MKIYLDNIIYSKVENGGVSNYWYELTQYFMKQERNNLFFFEDKNAIKNFHRKQLDLNPNQITTTSHTRILSRILPIDLASNEELIYHSSYFRKLSGAKNQIEVTTVYDFIHSYYASFISKTVHNKLKFSAINRSKGIICISQNTYKDLQKFCPPKKGQKIEIIYNGVSDDYFPILKKNNIQQKFINLYGLDSEYLLYIGGRTNYKNFDFVAQVLNENRNLKLVIVGGGSMTKKELQLFSSQNILRVIILPSVSNIEMNVLFNNAVALIYPSSYEGFGIPVIEAMKAGCPVIGLNNAVINEIASKSALLLEKLSISECTKHIQNLSNNNFRETIISNGLVEASPYSWEKCSRETLEFYEDLLN